MKKILLIFTGGTICSSPDGEGGKKQSDAKKTWSYLEQDFQASDSPLRGDVTFVRRFLTQDILSENMTVGTWNELLGILRRPETRTDYDGIVILHGTDTLAYTASLLSFLLCGFPVPICLVSAQLDLKAPNTNGYANFRCAVELVANGIAPNVYAVYQNLKGSGEPGEMLVHLGSRLLQCPNFSNNFHSRGEMAVPDLTCARLSGRRFETDTPYLDRVEKLSDSVLLIQPHTNLSYRRMRLWGVCAVVHGTYHSESVCIGRARNPKTDKNRSLYLREVARADREYSVLSLLARCKRRRIPVFLAPCDKTCFSYGTTKNALDRGAVGIPDVTLEAVYAKTVVGVSMGLRGRELMEFLLGRVNYEFLFGEET